MLVKLLNGAIEKYPYSYSDLRADFPQTSFPSDLSVADLSDFGVFPVTEVTAPVVDYTQVVEEGTPVEVNGVWTQVWNVRPATPAEQNSAMLAITREFTDAIQRHLDTEARTRGYDNILSACSYAAGNHPKYSAEGQACLDWREAVWDKGYEILADVQAGNRPMPTEQQVLAELPVMVWPT